MSHKNRHNKNFRPDVKPDEKKISHAKGVYVNLPVPRHEVIISLKADHSDMILSKYFETVYETAKLESETLLKAARIKYSFVWKLIAILSAVVFLVLGMFLQYKISPQWGSFKLDASPSRIEKTK